MSNTIDQRIVEMRFDNRQFESGAQTSINTLDKLKKSLNLDGAARGLEDVGSAAKKVDFSPLNSGLGLLGSRFSSLEVMAVTALANITNSAVNAGKRIVKEFTIDPIISGFKEYETQINAVQTILANTQSKGTTLDQVNDALDELNRYADKTIYNFTEMTNNIGKFTAAGVDLDTSVSAIQGIANLAAVSGSTSQQASTAMYQLSQALASGTVKLMDWNSVVNAGMGGQVFQDALKKTSEELGTGAEAAIKAEGSFRESLKTGWLTSEVLTKTLNKLTTSGANEWVSEYTGLSKKAVETALESAKAKYGEANAIDKASEALAAKSGKNADEIKSVLEMAKTAEEAATKVKTFTQLMDTLKEAAQSGWTQTWEILVGDFDQAKSLWSSVSDTLGEIINNSAEARNNLLSGALDSGWDQFLSVGMADKHVVQGYEEAVKSMAEENGIAFDKMIEDAGSFEGALKKGLQEGTITSDMLSESVTKVADRIRGMSSASAGYTEEQLIKIEELESGLKNGTISMDEFANKISRMSGRELIIDSLKNAFDGLMSILKPIGEAFREVFPRTTSDQLYDLIDKIHSITENFKLSEENAEKLKMAFKGLFSIISIGVKFITSLAAGVLNIIGGFSFLGSDLLNISAAFGEGLNNLRLWVDETDVFGNAIGTVSDLVKKFSENISKLTSPSLGMFEKVLNGVHTILQKIGNLLADVGKNIWDTLAGAISDINPAQIINIINSGILTGILLWATKAIKTFAGKLKSTTIGIVDSIKEVVDNVSGVLDSVRGSLKAWQQDLKAKTLISLATAVGILAASILVLSAINPDKLETALKAITGIFADLLISMAILSKIGSMNGGFFAASIVMISMSASVLILATALKKLSDIDSDQLRIGMIGIAGLTTIMVAMAKAMSRGGPAVIKGASQLLVMAFAIKVLASVCKDLSSLEWEELGKGIVGVSGLMGALSAFTKAVTINKKAISNAIGMVILASALKILANVCSDFSKLEWEEIGKGLAAIGGLLAELALFSNLSGKAEKLIATSVTVTIISFALNQICKTMKEFASMSWEGIAKGLSAMLGTLLSISLATRVMKTKDLFGASILLTALASAMLMLSKVFSNMAALSWEGIAKAMTAMIGSIAGLVAATKLLKGSLSSVVSLAIAATALGVLANSITMLAGIGWVGVVAGLSSIAGTFLILGVATKLLRPLIPSIFALSGSLATLGLSFVVLGAGITALGTGLTVVLTNFVTTALLLNSIGWDGIAKGFVAIVGVFATLGLASKILKPLIPSMLALSGAIALLGLSCLAVGVAISLVVSSLAALGAMGPEVANNISSTLSILVSNILDFIPTIVDKLTSSMEAIIVSIVKAIQNSAPVLIEGLLGVILQSVEYLRNYTPQIVSMLSGFVIDVLNELANAIPSMVDAVANVVRAFVDSIANAFEMEGSEGFLSSLDAISSIFLKIAAAAKIISMIPIKGTLTGLAGLGIAIAGMIAVLAALGGLAQIPGLSWVMSEGIKILSVIGDAIGSFVGSIVNGLVSSMPSDIGQIVTAFGTVAAIVAAISPVTEALGGMDINIASVAKGLAGAGIVIGGLIALMGVLGGLKQIPGFYWLMEEGAAVLAGIGTVLGEFVGSLFNGLAEAMTCDLEQVLKAIASIGAITIAIAGLSKIVKMVSIAGIAEGIAGIAIAVGGFAAILAALGGLKQIPGFDWILSEGSVILDLLGKALGSFVGSIISGLEVSATAGLPTMANNLSTFMTNLQPFIDGAKQLDVSILEAMGALAAAIICITAADIIQGITSFLTGGSSITTFGEDLVSFGKSLKDFSDSVEGVDPERVKAAAEASKALAIMAQNIPNEGGWAAWFAGENNVAKFGDDIASFGEDLKKFSDNVEGINPETVTAAANAAKSLTEMANNVPNEGGWAAWFAGENNISEFGDDIVSFGKDLKEFADNVEGIVPENVTAAASAATSLAEMAKTIPNEGGWAAWFAGDNNVAKFGTDIASFGKDLKTFSDNVEGINPENVTAAANGAKALAEMASIIPNEGGVASWFAGENSLSKFGPDIAEFGKHLKTFSDNIVGINPTNVSAAANAAKSLAEMASTIPNEGGVAAWFAGENSLASFGSDIAVFGKDIKAFSDNVTGIDVESVTAASNAGKALAEMTETIPPSDGVAQWFAGTNNLAKFGPDVASFGESMKKFSDNVTGIDTVAVETAAKAGVTLAKMTETIPPSDGVAQWFAGTNSLAKFGPDVASFGENMKKFSDNVTGIDTVSVTTAAEAGATLAKMTETIPPSDGVAQWFAGTSSLSSFGDKIATFGTSMKKFSDNVAGINSANVTTATTAATSLAEMTKVATGSTDLNKFGGQISGFADKLKEFSTKMSQVNVSSATSQIDKIVTSLSKVSWLDTSTASGFATALQRLAENGVTNFVKAFSNAHSTVYNAIQDLIRKAISSTKDGEKSFKVAGSNLISKLIDGIKSKDEDLESTLDSVPDKGLSAIKDQYSDFKSAGEYLAEGLANGIKNNKTMVTNAAADVMAAAIEAAKKEAGIESPAKETYEIGYFTVAGFVNAIDDNTYRAERSAAGMADGAIDGFRNAISKVSDWFSYGVDLEPTIRPVLDLSDVRAGAKTIGGMFDFDPSIGVLSNVHSINSMMNSRQNGANSDDLLSAINDLGSKLGKNSGDTYTINGITYDDGSNISSAVKSLVRATRIERRI